MRSILYSKKRWAQREIGLITYTINILYSYVYNNIIFISDGIKLFSCDICGDEFTERIVLMMHKDINHSQHIPHII